MCAITSCCFVLSPDQPDMARHLPHLLGLLAHLLPLLRACGVRHRPGHHADWRPGLFPGRVLGQQAAVFRRLR